MAILVARNSSFCSCSVATIFVRSLFLCNIPHVFPHASKQINIEIAKINRECLTFIPNQIFSVYSKTIFKKKKILYCRRVDFPIVVGYNVLVFPGFGNFSFNMTTLHTFNGPLQKSNPFTTHIFRGIIFSRIRPNTQ